MANRHIRGARLVTRESSTAKSVNAVKTIPSGDPRHLGLGTVALTVHDGPVSETQFELQPVQYRGRFTGPG
jgi:hypothetical protein